ncbi:protein mini spindles isoform X2 [Diachasma alloeum]|uniref:protein mini spindles isoform X2 n=1 Tax=Diachasma alloeum TaxID=454923 RepID=UPI00073845D5|nr:protein mini spindles isoform X2 [Diachasma alloeum]
MEEETEFTKLPLEDRVVHKSWKARVHGYEECTKKFGCIDDEKSPEWNKFLGLIKKFVVDSNAAAQEKGMEAALVYVENAACAGKAVGEVMSGIVSKCIAAPKAKTKDLAVQLSLMFMEIEKHETVQEELLKGTEAKNPKIVAACINTLTLSLREFGPKVVNVKPLVKKTAAFLEDRDKAVREEGKALVIEIYRWIGAPIKQQLNSLKPVQLTELETEFSKLGDEKAQPNRYLRSQKPKEICVSEAGGGDGDGDENDEDEEDGGGGADIDPYELIDPVDILSKLPKDFYEKLEAKKWQDRKEALETLETLLKNPKLESGDYGELVRVLKKIVSKDSNVVVVALAGKCLAGLASGLKKKFQPYACACLPALLEKFKEKKPTVVTVLREAVDAIFLSITIEAVLEDSLAALENKNPAVKAETASFLARCFARTPSPSLTKKLLKAYSGALLKTLNESDPTVRDNSAEALGTILKLVGEKAMTPFLGDLDNLKMAKIKECAEKAVIIVKISGPRKAERPTTAPAKIESSSSGIPSKTAKRPNTTATKKPAGGAKKPAGAAGPAAKKPVASKIPQQEKDLPSELVDEIAAETLPPEVLSGLVDANWKTRLQAVEQLSDFIKQKEPVEIPTQVIVRTLGKKPGFKDTNFQVLKQRLEVVKTLAEGYTFSATTSSYCIMDITEKLGDSKNSSVAAEALSAIAEATSFEHVANEALGFAFNQKNPKVQQETLLWLSNGLMEFGCTAHVKTMMDNIKKGVGATNPSVRTSAITLVGTLYLFMGRSLLMFFDSEKPALKQQIEQECDKRSGEVPPAPTRGPKSKAKSKATNGKIGNDQEDEDNYGGEDNGPSDLNDLLPRVDITNQITEALIAELGDKNWKVRNEGLVKVSNIINDAKFIKGSIGELPRALAPRLTDSNTKIAQAALGICEKLATAMGAPVKHHIRALFPGFIQCLGDSKNWIRAAAITCINTWGDQCGYKEFFDGEIIGDALKAGSPALRAELWSWLAQKLPLIPVKQIPKEELMACLPHLYSNLEDRNSDVRKNAQEAVLGFMIHLSYDGMVRQTEKLKPSSKSGVIASLDKARPNLPMKPLPSKKAPEEAQKTVKSGGAMKAAGKTIAKPKSGNSSKQNSARKKEEDVDTSPLLAINNLKHQRVIDEQKLKVLKWNFTTPREEFVELLKELMGSAGVNKSLIANMFHADFRYHLKAIETLTDDLQDNSKALVSNLDLILKWLTLRFFDTNPSVLLKGLDYLQTVFNLLIQDQYHMLENEAASFIPYLIIKIGDPKDAVRNGVRALFKQIALVYPVSKLFSYVMEGLKSKNARQRTECLDQLGSLIENYGVTICQPSPSAALREIAKQIADRDNSVRNAALNCIVQAYFLEGERVYKLIGQISEKDMSLLEERIKRAGKNRPLKSASSNRISSAPSGINHAVAPPSSTHAGNNADDCDPDDDDDDDNEDDGQDDIIESPEESNEDKSEKPPIGTVKSSTLLDCIKETGDEGEKSAPEKIVTVDVNDNRDTEKTYTSPISKTKVSGPFGLDMDFLKKLEENAPARWKIPELADLNWDPNETVNTLNHPPTNVIPITSPRIITTRSSLVSPVSTPVSKEDSLERSIIAMTNTELSAAISAMNNMEAIIKSPQASMIQSKEDKFIHAINMQLKMLQTYPTVDDPEVAKGFRIAFVVTLSFYDTGFLGKNVSLHELKDLVHQMLILLAENKLSHLSQADAYIRVVNSIVVKTIDHSNHTTIMCVLIKLLHSCAESKVAPKYEELVMKCLWKIVKTMPNWVGDLDYDTILLEVHNFFKDYPSSWWKKRASDMPLRTIKTVLHSMTKIKGVSILNHLTMINNTHESELKSYLNRLLETVKPDDINSGTRTITKQKHLSKTTHAQLSEIFKKIGSKHHTQEGLAQLYDFKLQHPEADVQPFLVKSHQFFQDFIEQGLKDIDQARRNQNVNSQMSNQYSETPAHPVSIAEERATMDPLQRLEKLRALEAKYHANAPSHSNPT